MEDAKTRRNEKREGECKVKKHKKDFESMKYSLTQENDG